MLPAGKAPNAYASLNEDDAGDGDAGDAGSEPPATPGSMRSPAWDRGLNSLDDLSAFFQTAVQGAAHPGEVARKLRERVKEVTEVHIHRDKKKTAEIETIDYLPQDSEMYRKWLHTQPLQRLWDRWMMMFLVGFVVGLCAFCLHVMFHTLAQTKARARLPRAPLRERANRNHKAPGRARFSRLARRAARRRARRPRAQPADAARAQRATLARRRTRCATSSPRTWAWRGCSTSRSRSRSWPSPPRACSGSPPPPPARACPR
jgi:hypothetical protein